LADDAELAVTWRPPWRRHHWRQRRAVGIS
jgi:hypothetical protein